jgi:hypothetical protein
MEPSRQVNEGVNVEGVQHPTLDELRQQGLELAAQIQKVLGDRDIERTLHLCDGPHSHVMECRECEQRGPVAMSSFGAAIWAVRHFRANPEHVMYQETLTRSYRAAESEGWW